MPPQGTWRTGSHGPLLAVLLLAVSCSSPTAPAPPAPPPPPPPPLTVECPTDQSVTATSATGATVAFGTPGVTGGVPPTTSSCTPASASIFPVGSTSVRCTATDAVQTTASCTFTVTVTAPAIPRLSRVTFLAFGDSMTAGEIFQPTGIHSRDGSPNFRLVVVPSASYPTQLLNQLRTRYTAQVSQIQVTNSGVPGEWAQDGARRLPGVMVSTRPEVVLLLEGVNDIVALGSPGVSRAAAAIDTMAKEVRNRGARLLLATVPPTAPHRAAVVPIAQIEALNAMIRTTARGEGAIVVDLYEALSADVPRYIGADGVHPTEAGYQRIAETFFAAIRAELEMRQP